MLRSTPVGSVPADTARVANAALPKGHPYLTIGDELGTLFTDDQAVTRIQGVTICPPDQRSGYWPVAALAAAQPATAGRGMPLARSA